MPDGHLIPPSSSSTKETSSTTSVQVADGHLMPPTETSTRIMPDGGLVYSSSSTTGSGSNMGSATPSGSLSMVSVHGDSSAVSMPRSSNDIIDDADAGVQLVLSAALVVAICIVRML
jgi:hypothetical protein